MTRPFSSFSEADAHFAAADWHQVIGVRATLWRSGALEKYGFVSHGFTGAGYNMSPNRGPDVDATPGRWREVCELIDADFERMAGGAQVHGTRIVRVAAYGERPGATRLFDDCDAVMTDDVGLPLMAMSADCPVLLVVESRRRALGLAHCGWRGTVAGLPGKLIAAMRSSLRIEPSDAVAVIAPSAGVCCYEIQDDVSQAVTANVSQHVRRRDGRQYLDLSSLIAEQVVAAGVPGDHTYLPGVCTICDTRFYSYRRQGPDKGLAGLVACLL